MNAAKAAEAADRLVDSRLNRRAFDRLPTRCRPRTEADGYRVQELVHERLTAAGRARWSGTRSVARRR